MSSAYDQKRVEAMGGVTHAWQHAAKLREAAQLINSALHWSNTPEGSTFWGEIHQKLVEYENACIRLKIQKPKTIAPATPGAPDIKQAKPGLNDKIKSVNPATWRMSS